MLAPPFRVGVHTVWDILDPLLLTKISSVKVHCTIKLVCVTEHMVVTSMKNYLKNNRTFYLSDIAFFLTSLWFSSAKTCSGSSRSKENTSREANQMLPRTTSCRIHKKTQSTPSNRLNLLTYISFAMAHIKPVGSTTYVTGFNVMWS